MTETENPTCKINETHCENCGSTDGEDLATTDGYTGCCNELLAYGPSDCRAHHEDEGEYDWAAECVCNFNKPCPIH